MNRFEVSVEIDRPIADVWGYLSDVENELVWQASSVERKQLTEGPLAKGTRSLAVDRFLGRRIETEWEILELHDYELRQRTVTGPFEMEIDWRLEPVGASTRFTMEMTAESGGFFGKLADAVVVRIAKREWEGNLKTLADILEADVD